MERAISPDRITQPLRRGADGTFHPIGWNEAIESIAVALERAQAEHGPQSVLYYSGSGTKGLS